MKHSLFKFSICDVYVVLYVLYVLQGIFISTSRSAMFTLLPLLLLTIYYFVYSFFRYRDKPRYIRALSVFIIMLTVYGVFNWLGGIQYDDVKPISFLLTAYTSVVPVMCFYVFAREGLISESRLKIYFVCFLALAVVQYFSYFTLREIETITGAISDRTNNEGYTFVCLLPLLLVFRDKKIILYPFLAIMLYFIMSAMKRGAILITAFYIVWFIFFFNDGQKKSKSSPVITLLFLMVLAYILSYLVQHVWIGNDYFMERMELTRSGDMNGRDSLYSVLWNYYLHNTNVLQMLFGIGAEGTQRVAGMHAHNDWLELLIDCGLLGIVVYLYYFACLFFDVKKYRKIRPESGYIIACLGVLFIRSFFSMSYGDMDLSISMALGYGIAMCEMKGKNGIINSKVYENSNSRKKGEFQRSLDRVL